MTSMTTNGSQALATKTPSFHRYISLTAFTPDDEPIATTTWFAALAGKLYVRLSAHASVVGFIRQHAHVSVLPTNRAGEARGLAVVGKARIVPQFETYEPLHAIDQKYGIAANVSHLVGDDQGLGGEVLLEITLDPGPGTPELLQESAPEALRTAERNRAFLIGAAGVGLSVLLLIAGLRRKRA